MGILWSNCVSFVGGFACSLAVVILVSSCHCENRNAYLECILIESDIVFVMDFFASGSM